MAPRKWRWWTTHKLDILSDYLRGFTTSSKSAKTTVYLDLFGGQRQNVSQETGEPIDGSALRAIKTEPPFGHVLLFEMPSKARELDKLKDKYPARSINVYPGDCNQSLLGALQEIQDLRDAPTFAFVDQEGPDVKWSTLNQLADHKRGHSSTKVELWILLATPLLRRQVADQDFRGRVTEMIGTDYWEEILRGQQYGDLRPADVRNEFNNLFRWRLMTALGYSYTLLLEFTNTGNIPIYDMIFAGDHPVGKKIMTYVCQKAANDHPLRLAQAQESRRRERNERAGIYGLDLDLPIPPRGLKAFLTDDPPWEPSIGHRSS